MTLSNGKLVRAFVILVTELLLVLFQLLIVESAPSVRRSVRTFVCACETSRTPYNGVL
jgi:hypothetical protein